MKIHLRIKNFFSRHLSPSRIFVLSFAAVILIGGILLWFPFSASKGNVRFVDALFTSTSAVCVLPLERRLVWLGAQPVSAAQTRQITITLQGRFADTVIHLPQAQGQWFHTVIKQATPRKNKTNPYPWVRDIQAGFPGEAEDFVAFLQSPGWRKTRAAGLLLV